MKYVKLFESYLDDLNKEEIEARIPSEDGDSWDDYDRNDKYEEARAFADKWNSEYEYIVFVDGKPKTGWEYMDDAINDGVLEGAFGYSRHDLDDNLEELLEISLDYADGGEGDLDDFADKFDDFVQAMNTMNDSNHSVEIVKI